jgi:hypothetical protein
MGQLAGAQQQSDIARMGLQNQLGQQQQQYQQGIINQAIQDYATQQQYPFMQLGTMSNLLRGLPMQSMTTQQYQAAPSAISQLGGLGATALGAYGAAGGFKAKGGTIKEKKMAIGGLADSGVANSIEAQLKQMDLPQLIQVAKTNPSEVVRKEAARLAAEKQAAQQAEQSMGLAAAPAPNMDDMSMAGGGIVAFAGDTEDGSLVDEEALREKYSIKPDSALMGIANNLGYLGAKGYGQQTPEIKAIAQNIAEAKKGLGDAYDDKNLWQSIMAGGIGAMKGTSQHALSNIAGGFESGLGTYMKGEARKEDLLNKLRQGEIDLSKLTTSERNNLLHYATSAASTEENAKLRLEGVKHNAALRGIEAGKREDARLEGQRLREENAIREWTKIFIGTGNQNPSEKEVLEARKKAELQVRGNPLNLPR